MVPLFELVPCGEDADERTGPHAIQNDVAGSAKWNDQLTKRWVLLLPRGPTSEGKPLEHLDGVSNGHFWLAARALAHEELGELDEVFERFAREPYFEPPQGRALRFALLEP